MVIKKYCLLFIFICCSYFTYAQANYDQSLDKELKQSEQKLNTIYRDLLKEYVKNIPFTKNLKISQKAWLAYREADLLMKYPEADTDKAQELWGTIYPFCKNLFYIDYNNKRVKYLSKWLKSSKRKDGDCTGSVHDFLNKS